MKSLVYTIGNPLKQPQTGGDKRFEEFVIYACKNRNADVCGAFDEETARKHNIYLKYHLRTFKSLGFMPPVISSIISNYDTIYKIHKKNYDKIIVFDVPVAFTLCFFKIKNVVILIRKDLVGYANCSTNNKGMILYLKILVKRWMESICLRNCKNIITQCEYDKNELLARHARIKNKVENKFNIQINNINPSWIIADIDKARINADNCFIDNHVFNICFIGNFNDHRKGHDLLLAVAAKITKRYNDIYFHIIGGGNDIEHYKKLYASEQVIFYGFLQNPGTVVIHSKLMVVPSLADSCPNTVMEALYAGIPVIGSNRGGIPEILLDKKALFDIDEKKLYQKINELYLNKEQLERLKKRQSKRAEQLTFDWCEKIDELIYC